MHDLPPRKHSACKPRRSRGSPHARHTGHCQIHADLAALALEVGAQTIDDLLRNALSLADAHNVLGDVGVAGLLDECGSGSLQTGHCSGMVPSAM